MFNYKNLNGNSNVESYFISDDRIVVKFFGTKELYTYSYASAGITHVNNMKQLAIRGYGLNSYINNYCKYSYESKR